jgi:hypothetical protein
MADVTLASHLPSAAVTPHCGSEIHELNAPTASWPCGHSCNGHSGREESVRIPRIMAVVGWCAFATWSIATVGNGVELSRGRQILLDRGLQIHACSYFDADPSSPHRFDVGLWASANFTAVNGAVLPNTPPALPPGALWGLVYAWEPQKYLTAEQEQYLSSFVSYQYQDEGNPLPAEALPDMQATFREWNRRYPNVIAHTNFYGAWEPLDVAGLQSFMQTTQPDMMMFDYYPDFSIGARTPNDSLLVTRNRWYSAMQRYRDASLLGNDGTGQRPIPYAQWLNLYRTSYSHAVPNESFVRLQQFASWAFGYTFVEAFKYKQDPNSVMYPVMFTETGEPTAAFDYVAETNRQSRNLGPALVRLVSTNVGMIPARYYGTENPLPDGMTRWQQGAGGSGDYITSITPLGRVSSPNSSVYSDVLVGYLAPLLSDNGPNYTFVDGLHFMIVNGATGQEASAAELAEQYRISFNFGSSDYDALVRLDRNTGQVVPVALTYAGSPGRYYYDLTLEGGTGELFRFWDSSTPLPTIPEPSMIVMGITGVLAALAYAVRRRR